MSSANPLDLNEIYHRVINWFNRVDTLINKINNQTNENNPQIKQLICYTDNINNNYISPLDMDLKEGQCLKEELIRYNNKHEIKDKTNYLYYLNHIDVHIDQINNTKNYLETIRY